MGEFEDPRQPVDFFTLGMFITDQIDDDETEIIGGAGTYAALGARLVSGDKNSGTVGWIVDMGSDFPTAFKAELESWRTRCFFRSDLSRLTTRAWNGILEGEERVFRYLTPKRRLEGSSLPTSFLFSKAFHLVCSGARLIEQVNQVLSRRQSVAKQFSISVPPRPLFVWEPIPDLCTPSELENFWEAIKLVNVVSPNELELSNYFAVSRMSDSIAGTNLTPTAEIMKRGIGPNGDGMLVVRTGKEGSTAFTRKGFLQMRPYFQVENTSSVNSNVIDSTGGGNTFLGGLTRALVGDTVPSLDEITKSIMSGYHGGEERSDLKRTTASLVLAHIAASFAIQQKGTPVVSSSDMKTTWNNETVDGRVERYTAREKTYLMEQGLL